MDAITAALELEKTVGIYNFSTWISTNVCQVNQNLLDLQQTSESKKDAHLSDFIPTEFLDDQVGLIKEIGDLISKMKRAGDGLGLHVMDRELA